MMSADDRSRHRFDAALLITCVLSGICLLPSIFLPLARDQGAFGYVGQVILDGGYPYRDAFDIKGPAVHYTFALALAVLGDSDLGVRLLFFFVSWIGAMLAGVIGARLGGSVARLPCALAYSVAVLQGDPAIAWHSAQAEDLILTLTLGAIVLLGSDRLRATGGWRLAAASALLGLTCLYKPTAVTSCLAVFAVAVWSVATESRPGVSGLARLLAWGAAGGLTPAAAFGGYLALAGVLDDFWRVVVLHNMNVYQAALRSSLSDGLAWQAPRFNRLAILALFSLFGDRGLRRSPPRTMQLLLAALLGFAAAFYWQRKFFAYHATPIAGCLAILGGVGATWIWCRLTSRWAGARQRRAGMAVVIVLLVTLFAPARPGDLPSLFKRTAAVLTGGLTLDEFRAPFAVGAADSGVTREVADYLASHSRPADTALVWGLEPLINFRARRRAPTRFIYAATLGVPGPYREGYRAELLRDVTADPPRYVVVVEGDQGWTPFTGQDSLAQLREWRELNDWFERHYLEETTIGPFRVHVRK